MSKGGNKLIAAIREGIEDVKAGRFTVHERYEDNSVASHVERNKELEKLKARITLPHISIQQKPEENA